MLTKHAQFAGGENHTELPEKGLDPFYLYLDLVQHFGSGHVFLLDAAQDNAAPQYQKSILGISPLVEVMIKNHYIALVAEPGLLAHLRHALTDEETRWRSVDTTCLDGTESVVGPDRLCFHAVDPMLFLEHLRRVLRLLLPETAQIPFSSGLLGYIGYDAVHYLEVLPRTTVDDRMLPDIRLQWHAFVIHLTDRQLEQFDSSTSVQGLLTERTKRSLTQHKGTIAGVLAARMQHPNRLPDLLAAALNQGDDIGGAVTVHEDVTPVEYEDNVRRAIEYIRAGDIFQVVLSKRVRVAKRLHHYVVYDRLRHLNPSPYMFMAEYAEMRVFGTSPEVQFRVVNGLAEMRPIAGTSKGRGATPDEDDALARRLSEDEKEQAEHVMLVDLCRNDLGRVCRVNSVRVPEYLVAERYSHVIHLVSSVCGVLKADVSVFHALLATFPAGTLSGAPKIRAMEIIDELERVSRGPYGGMMGMIDFEANANTAIIIRSVVETGNAYYVQAGAGIVADSDPLQEWLECGRKSGAMLDVLQQSNPRVLQ